jgi:putative restriction endonuclease
MSRAVFTTKITPTYDDLPEVRYHFPRTYLNQAAAAVGNWVLYYEPRRSTADTSSRGGRQVYFAVARVTGVEPDQQRTDHYYALISDYLELDRPVPFREGVHYYESGLMRADGKTNKGAFGRAVRSISDFEFDQILSAGFSRELQVVNHDIRDMGYIVPAGMAEEQSHYTSQPTERARFETTLTRPFRDEAFRRHVRLAYDNRCAMSGLKLINGGGRPEVQAAHIQPVASSGPDSIRNGLALSGTLHWMFDRGLLSIDDDYRVLRATAVPEEATRLLLPEGRLLLPSDTLLRPHPSFLKFHRDTVFKG